MRHTSVSPKEPQVDPKDPVSKPPLVTRLAQQDTGQEKPTQRLANKAARPQNTFKKQPLTRNQTNLRPTPGHLKIPANNKSDPDPRALPSSPDTKIPPDPSPRTNHKPPPCPCVSMQRHPREGNLRPGTPEFFCRPKKRRQMTLAAPEKRQPDCPRCGQELQLREEWRNWSGRAE